MLSIKKEWEPRHLVLLAATIAFVASAAPTQEKLVIIDSHIHLWNFPRDDGALFPVNPNYEIPWLKRDCLMADYDATEGGRLTDGVVLIESSVGLKGDALLASNEWMLERADKDKRILAVVGSLDLRSKRFEEDLGRLATHPKFVGLRANRNIFDESSKLDTRASESLRILEKNALSLDLLGVAPLSLAKVADELPPNLVVVLNHFASKTPTLAIEEDWKRGIEALVKYPNIHVKISDWQRLSANDVGGSWPMPYEGEKDPDKYRALFKTVLDALGPNRLIFGSNWPVIEGAGSVDHSIRILDYLLTDEPSDTRDSLFFKNAARVYRIPGYND